MPLIELPIGTTIYVSSYEYYFKLEDDDMDEFYQSCIADNLGVIIENPFAMKATEGRIEEDDDIVDTK